MTQERKNWTSKTYRNKGDKAKTNVRIQHIHTVTAEENKSKAPFLVLIIKQTKPLTMKELQLQRRETAMFWMCVATRAIATAETNTLLYDDYINHDVLVLPNRKGSPSVQRIHWTTAVRHCRARYLINIELTVGEYNCCYCCRVKESLESNMVYEQKMRSTRIVTLYLL